MRNLKALRVYPQSSLILRCPNVPVCSRPRFRPVLRIDKLSALLVASLKFGTLLRNVILSSTFWYQCEPWWVIDGPPT